jgi:hypothetical protein
MINSFHDNFEENVDQKNLIKENNNLSRQNLINNIGLHVKNAKELENAKHLKDAREEITKITNDIKLHIDNHSQNLSNEEIGWLNILHKSYENKEKSYDYHSYINSKKSLIFQKMTEKYIGVGSKKGQGRQNFLDNENAVISNKGDSSNFMEYEVIPGVSTVTLIKEIAEICTSLLKYFEIQNENYTKDAKALSLRPVQSYESFYVCDYAQNTIMPSAYGFNISEKYVQELKNIKNQCEKISKLMSENDTSLIKKLEKEIAIITEEFQKIYPKFVVVKDILEKNNLVRGKK